MSIIYLTLEQILLIHDEAIEQYGGSHGVRDLRLLESALMRPQTTFAGEDLYPSIYFKAAALMHSLIMNHPFIDGNKRTGTISTLVFLELNNFRLDVEQKELVGTALKVESKKWNIEELAEWLEKNSKKIKIK